MKKFKHSGTFGDLIYSLAVVKELGGGEFYLHLNQIDWICQHFYGGVPDPMHIGRMTEKDFHLIKTFLETQPYITKVDVLTNNVEITHNLDKFRPLFVGHPTNYINLYADIFKFSGEENHKKLQSSKFLFVDKPKKVENRSVAINRTERWLPSVLSQNWKKWKDEGLEQKSFFLGLPKEYEQFKKITGFNIPYQQTENILELAEYIDGAEEFIGNQSVALSIAVGLSKRYWCEKRTDLPLDRNECYFPYNANGNYF